MTKFKNLPVNRYIEWLTAYVHSGGAITHVYDYPYQRKGFLLAISDFTLGDECGSSARPILVPSNIHYLGGKLGHNNLYFEGNENIHIPTIQGNWVPAYNNPEFANVPGYARAKHRTDEEHAAFIAERRRRINEEKERIRTSDLSAHITTNSDKEQS